MDLTHFTSQFKFKIFMYCYLIIAEGTEIDELCPSMYSFHSDINEKNKLLHIFYEAGIETTVDRVAKKERIRQWIQNSVINEEDENEVIISIFSTF